MEEHIRITEPARNLRRMARAALKEHWKTALLAYVLYILLISVPAMLLESILGGGELAAVQSMVELYRLIIQGPLLLGISVFFLDLVRGAEHGPGMILGGFNNFFKAFGLFLLFTLFMLLWMLPVVVPLIVAASLLFGALFVGSSHGDAALGGVASTFLSPGGALFVCVLVVLVLVIAVVFMLTYAQAFFLLADDPGIGTGALRRSRGMMRGNKWKLFCLTISFAGWYIVPFVVFCAVLSLSMPPYLSSATATAAVSPAVSRLLTLIASLLFAPVQVYVTAAGAIFYDILTGRRRLLPLDAGEAWHPIGGESES
ncbi:MAG: DUF975 family protein, partial [Clostridiales Family XIII bacterium]|nr:DUF975 family protein [Clostridiales Family XIII bacterium]